MKDPEADDGALVPRERAAQRAQDEHEEPGFVHAHTTEHVTESSHLGREQRDHKQVPDHDPDDRRERDLEAPLDLGQGEHNDRGVDGGDEDTRHDHDHRESGTRRDGSDRQRLALARTAH